MLVLLMGAYLLLALRLSVCLDAALGMDGGSVSVSLRAAGVQLRFDGRIRREGLRLRIAPRYGKPRRQRRKTSRQKTLLRFVRRRMLEALRSDPDAAAFVQIRLGLGDAGETALAAGSLRALLRSAGAALGARVAVHVAADYAGACFCAQARCIFSLQVGDVILAAIKAANKTGREGFGWKSIPLRA